MSGLFTGRGVPIGHAEKHVVHRQPALSLTESVPKSAFGRVYEPWLTAER
jgi:hypothetical protein